MDSVKTGKLINYLRHEKGLTQVQLAYKLNVSDKAVSKWERGLGCPDISMLSPLSELLGVGVDDLLTGELPTDKLTGGNMKKSNYYVCPVCGNISLCTGEATVSCCGRKLTKLVPEKPDDSHKLKIENI